MEWNGWVNWRKTRGDKESGEMSEKEKRDGMNRSDADAADRYSLRGRVFHRLREDILNGKYKELEELKEAAIAAVSYTQLCWNNFRQCRMRCRCMKKCSR